MNEPAQEKRLRLRLLPYDLSIVRQKPENQIPGWIDWNWHFVSVTKTADEFSIILETENVLEEAPIAEHGWRAFMVEGPLDFELTGIIASIATPLAENGVSIFAFSTFDTDYILVKKDKLEEVQKTLSNQFDVGSF